MVKEMSQKLGQVFEKKLNALKVSLISEYWFCAIEKEIFNVICYHRYILTRQVIICKHSKLRQSCCTFQVAVDWAEKLALNYTYSPTLQVGLYSCTHSNQ